ncbi:hypothetical protein I0C86_26035 [Plantactinospora sp. S1510]|uniref:Uncharacterized protein n=1 Tax=Plantactinospora alkalitolerans TaxID=2789879 RepID=A0ABS0H1Q1_9ACTN|nr:hypothetical protein [Plantactinospora alkalitolerans]MBF9132382.1 hypothetical protein [Plantactinospora alkalitolerans]
MSDAHPSDRRPSVDSGAIEITSEPVVLAAPDAPHTEATDITPTADPDGPVPAGGLSRRRKIVLGSVLAVALAGAAGLGSVGWRIAQEKDATLTTPAQVAGLNLDDSERARTTADYLRTGFTADINAQESIGAVYADPAAPERSVLLFGGTALVWQPERDLDRLFDLVAEGEGTIDELREVDAGSLGGVMKCGRSTGPEGDLAVCGWADHGSVAMAMFPGRTVDESAALLRDIRGTVQSRN